MLLKELFDKPEEIKWTYFNKYQAHGIFNINKMQYAIHINDISDYQEKDYDPGDVVDIEFLVKGTRKGQGITDTGNEIKVFSTVISGITEWVKQYKPKVISFIAKEPSRRKLYERMIRVIGSKLGYKLHKDTKVVDDEKEYYLVRK